MLDNGVASAIVWLDTTDMISEGLTKGAASRDALMAVLDGHLKFAYAAKAWSPKVLQQ